MASPEVPYQTFRISSLPLDLRQSDLVAFTNSKLRCCLTHSSLAKNHGGTSQLATVTFEARRDEQARILDDLKGLPWETFLGSSTTVRPRVDVDFYGLTPLNDCALATQDLVDVIAITGIGGNAFASWQSASTAGSMWLRDYIPRDLGSVKVQVYGYESALPKSLSAAGLTDYTMKFLDTVWSGRRHKQVPLVLVGHSLGCLIIKQALVLSRRQQQYEGFHRSVYSVVLFGAPHNGMDTEALHTCVYGQPTQRLIEDLTPGSSLLQSLRDDFKQVLRTIKVVTYYELKKTPTARIVDGRWERTGPERMMVSPDSACINVDHETVISINENHSMIAKLSDAENSDYWRLQRVLMEHVRAAPLIVRRDVNAYEGAELLRAAITRAQSVFSEVASNHDNSARLYPTLGSVITLTRAFQDFLQDEALVQAVWPKGVTTAASSFFEALNELSAVIRIELHGEDLAAERSRFGSNASGSRLLNRVKNLLLGMNRSLTFSLLGDGDKAVQELERTSGEDKVVLDVLTLRQMLASRVQTRATDASALDGKLDFVQDLAGTQMRIMEYTANSSSDTTTSRQQKCYALVEYRNEDSEPVDRPRLNSYLPQPSSGQVTKLAALLRSSNLDRDDALSYTEGLQTSFGTFRYMGHMQITENRNWALIFQIPQMPPRASLDDIMTLERLLNKDRADSAAFKLSLATHARFNLAYHCCLYLLAFHSCGWIHKDIRSANIILVPKPTQNSPLASALRQHSVSATYGERPTFQPYFAGFGLAREIQDESNLTSTAEVETNLYRHPDRQHIPIWKSTQLHDIYALGVVLYEIGVCRNMRHKFRTPIQNYRVSGNFMSRNQVRRELLQMCVDELPALMGADYTRAVVRCLTGDFGVEGDDDRHSELGAAFQRLVMEPIERGTRL